MFLGKKARSLKTLKTLPMAIFAVAAGILGLVWLDADSAEARGRSITLTRNELTIPEAASGNGNVPCRLQSLVEWDPLGPTVEVQIFLQRRRVGTITWTSLISDPYTQLLPGKATGAAKDWVNVTPGFQYRQLSQVYSLKGKDGASRNHQLVSEFTSVTPEVANCGQNPD